MSEQNIPEGAQGKEEEAPEARWEAAREQGEALADEVTEMSRAARRAWKVNALVFGAIVAIIAFYLGVFVYRPVSRFLDPEELVYMAMGRVAEQIDPWADRIVGRLEANADQYMDDYLVRYLEQAKEKLPTWREEGAKYLNENAADFVGNLDPTLKKIQEEADEKVAEFITKLNEDAEENVAKLDPYLDDAVENFREFAAKQTEKYKDEQTASELVEESLVPMLEDLQQEGIPDARDRLIKQLNENASKWMDSFAEQVTGKGLPQVRKLVEDSVDKQADRVAEQVKDTLDERVRETLVKHEADIEKLRKADPAELQRLLEATFEDEMGPVVDQYLRLVERALSNWRNRLEYLVEGKEAEVLNKEEELEYRVIQLCRTLLVRKLAEYEPEELEIPLIPVPTEE